MCVAGRLRTARGSLGTVFCAFRLLARRLLWARGIQGLDEEHLVTPFLTRLRRTLADPLPLPVLGVSRGLQGQGQHPAKRTQLGGVLQKSFT